jgi:putative endonuclease
MGFIVYILYSRKTDRYYIGQSSDIFSRLARHNAGLENYTSKGVPKALRWKTEKATRDED